MKVYVWVRVSEPDFMDGSRISFVMAFRNKKKAENMIKSQHSLIQSESELFECELE